MASFTCALLAEAWRGFPRLPEFERHAKDDEDDAGTADIWHGPLDASRQLGAEPERDGRNNQDDARYITRFSGMDAPPVDVSDGTA